MKNFKLSFFVYCFCFTLFMACDPPRTGAWTFGFSATGKFNNNNEVLSVGDTLKFTFALPDTLYLQNGLGDSRVEVRKKPAGGFLGYKLYKIDTLIKIPELNFKEKGIEAFVNPGTTDVIGSPVFQINEYPYGFVLNMVIKKPGLYCFTLDAAMGGRFSTGTKRASEVYIIRPSIAAADLHKNLGAAYLTSDWLATINQQSAGYAYYFRVR